MLKKVGMIVNPDKKDAGKNIKFITTLFANRQIPVFAYQKLNNQYIEIVNEPDLYKISDLIIVLGGDGTLLSAGRKIIEHNKPVLPINVGTMGFLSEINPNEFKQIFDDIVKNKFSIEKRITLYVKTITDSKSKVIKNVAINEVLVSREVFNRMLKFKVYINNELVARFKSDGLIISTPAGSTGHSLSAGGPVLHPKLSAIIMTPFCAHTLSARPLIFPDTSIIKIDFEESNQNVIVTFDGQVSNKISTGSNIIIKKSIYHLNIVKNQIHSFYEILRKKLSWLEQ